MAYGLRIIGSHGVAQIDHEYRNLTLIEKGTLNLATRDIGFSEPIYYGLVGPKSGLTSPVLALRPLGDTSCGVWYLSRAGGNWTWQIDGTSGAPGAGQVEWFLFDVAPSAPASGFGLAVYTPAGEVAFHHNMKPMRVAGPMVGGRTYAMAIADPAYSYSYTNLGESFDMPGYNDYGYASEMNVVVPSIALTRITLSNFITQYMPGTQPPNQPIPPNSHSAKLLLDVTHY